MPTDVIKIAKRSAARGEDGFKVFSIRVKDIHVAALDALAAQSNRSRNELINIFIDWGLSHSVVDE